MNPVPTSSIHPLSSHWYSSSALHIHAVSSKCTTVLVALHICTLEAILLDDFRNTCVGFRKQFAKHGAEIPQELLRLLRTAYDHSRQSGKPLMHIIAHPPAEFLTKLWSPVALVSLIAVHHHIEQSPVSDKSSGGFFIYGNIILEITSQSIRVKLIHFKSGSLHRSRVVAFAGERCPETIDHPVSFRNFPFEHSIPELRSNVNDFSAHVILAGRRCRVVCEIVRCGICSLFLRVIYLGVRIQDELRNAGPLPHTELHPEMLCCDRLKRNCLRKQIADRNAHYCTPCLSVITHHQRITAICGNTAESYPLFGTYKSQASDGLRLGETVLHPSAPLPIRYRKRCAHIPVRHVFKIRRTDIGTELRSHVT